jgi:hypothetical protein
MIRYMVAAVLVSIYLAGSIWVVGTQGQAYRNGLSKRKPVATENEESAIRLPEERVKTVPTVVAPKPVAQQPKPGPTRLTTADPPADPVVRPLPPARAVAEPERSKAKPVAERAEAKPANPPGLNPAPGAFANPFAASPFWNLPQVTKNWDVSSLKPEDELQLGAELHDLIVQLNPLVDDAARQIRIEEAAEPFYKNLHRKEIKYKFFIVNSDTVNAFSHPGGYVYVSRGLLDLIGEDKDYALQFAIGHEIAHVDRQHAIRCLQDPDVMKMKWGTLQKLYGLIIPRGYLESQKTVHEFEADEWVANGMLQIDRTRRETLNFLQILDGYARTHGFGSGHAGPTGQMSPLDNHYRALTAPWRRLKHLREIMAEAAKAPK